MNNKIKTTFKKKHTILLKTGQLILFIDLFLYAAYVFLEIIGIFYYILFIKKENINIYKKLMDDKKINLYK